MPVPFSAVSPSYSFLSLLPSGNTAISCAPDRNLRPHQSRRLRSMVRSDGCVYGLKLTNSCHMLGIFDILCVINIRIFECIMVLSGNIGRAKKGGYWMRVFFISVKMLMIPPPA